MDGSKESHVGMKNGHSDPSQTKEQASANSGPSPSPRAIPAWLIVSAWICISTGVILYNREIMVGAPKFRYPICLTSMHLTYQVIATRLLHRYTNLISGLSHPDYSAVPMDDLEGSGPTAVSRQEEIRRAKAESVAMTWDEWKVHILPPAFLFSLSLVLSNWAYLYLNVGFLSILKSASPVSIYIAALAFGLRQFQVKIMFIVCLISLGVALASWGEVNFNWIGFTIQSVAIAVEATRVTLIQILLQSGREGRDMSPLKTLYYFAPVCLAFNAVLILPIEGMDALRAIPRLGLFTILSNASMTFALNVAATYLIGISSMVLSLSKVVKDICLVAGSAVLLGERLSPIQMFGYTLATVCLFWYKMA